MQQYIGKFGTDRGATEILEGKFASKQFTNLPAVNHWIKNNIRRVAAANSVDISLTVEELKQLLKKKMRTQVHHHLATIMDTTMC
eukprot:2359914-Ditylum_brightwellii.AAC.1